MSNDTPFAQLTEQQKINASNMQVDMTASTETVPRIDPKYVSSKSIFDTDINVEEQSNEALRRTLSTDITAIKVENATLLDKYWGLSNVFDGTDVGGVIDYFRYDRGIFRSATDYISGNDNEEFKSSFDKSMEDAVMREYGLPETSRRILQEAVNQNHLLDLAQQEQAKNISLNKVMNTYTDEESAVANIAVSVGTDPTVILTGGLRAGIKTVALVAKAESSIRTLEATKKGIAIANSGFDVTYGAVNGAVNEDTSMLESLIGYSIASAIDYKLINGIDMRLKPLMKEGAETAIASKKADDIAKAEANRFQYKNDLKTKIEESKTPNGTRVSKSDEYRGQIFDKLDELDNYKAGSKKHNKLLKEIDILEKQIDELDSIGKGKKTSILTEAQIYALKHEIKARKNLFKSDGFKVMLEEASKKIYQSELVKKAKEYNIVKQAINDVKELAVQVEMDITDIKKSVEVLAKTDAKYGDNAAEDVMSIYRELHNGGYLSKSAIDQLENSYKKGKGIAHPKVEYKVKKTKDGFNTTVKINGRVVKVLGASALVASIASADTDGGEIASNAGMILGLGILAVALGINPLKVVKTDGFKLAGQKAFDTVKRATAYDKTRGLRSNIGAMMNRSRTSLNETITPMLEKTEGKIKDFVKDFYYNPLDAEARNIDMERNFYVRGKAEGLERELKDTFKNWIKDSGISRVENIFSMFTDLSHRARFNKDVFEYMVLGKNADNPHIANAANITSRYYKQVKEDMLASGMKGADKMIEVTDSGMYVPRIPKGIEFANKISGITDESYRALVSRFAEMLVNTKNAEDVAEAYLHNLIRTDFSSAKTFSKDARLGLEKELRAKGLDDNSIDEVIATISGQYGRTKARLNMDYKQFGELEISFMDGNKVKLTYDDIFNSDISSVSNSLFNQVGGHIAFANKGYKSFDDVIAMITDANIDTALKRTLLNDAHAMVGTPAIDFSQTFNIFAKNISNIAIGKGMIYSTISLMSEGIVAIHNILNNAGVIKGMSKLKDAVFKTYGEDAFAMSNINFGEDGLGLSQSRFGANFGQFRTFDEFGNINSGLGKFTKYTEMYRDFTLHAIPFSRTSDFISNMNIQDIVDTLYSHINGIKRFKDYELSAFPISKEMEEMLKKNLQLNSKGYVKFFDYTKLPYQQKMEFKTLLNNMMMKRMNQTTFGTSGAFTRNSALGVALSPMLKFPMTAYSNIGGYLGRGVLNGDAFAMIQTALWFQAGIIQHMIRSEIQGRDYDDNDLVYAGLSNMPAFGLYGTVVGFGDSPTAKTAKDLTDIFNIYSYIRKN